MPLRIVASEEPDLFSKTNEMSWDIVLGGLREGRPRVLTVAMNEEENDVSIYIKDANNPTKGFREFLSARKDFESDMQSALTSLASLPSCPGISFSDESCVKVLQYVLKQGGTFSIHGTTIRGNLCSVVPKLGGSSLVRSSCCEVRKLVESALTVSTECTRRRKSFPVASSVLNTEIKEEKLQSKRLHRLITAAEANFAECRKSLENSKQRHLLAQQTPSVSVSRAVHEDLRSIATGPLISEVIDRARRQKNVADFLLQFLKIGTEKLQSV